MPKYVVYRTGNETIDRNLDAVKQSLDASINKISDSGIRASLGGQQAASTLGTVTGKIAIYGDSGNLIGYLPVYGNIT